MSDDKDPQRISDAADNCEVLRARLAEYEDAEGRPVAGHLAVINKAYMALIGYLPGHRNTITDEAIEACRSALNSHPVSAGEKTQPSNSQLMDLARECAAMPGGSGMLYANYGREVLRRWGSIAEPASTQLINGMADALRHVIKELDAEACEDIDYAQVSSALAAYELFKDKPASDVVPVRRELPPFAQKVIAKLKRFEECTDDGQGADIGRNWFDLLTQLGLLNRVQRSPGLWEISQQGEDLLNGGRS